MRVLRKNSFEILQSNEGKEYLELKYNEATKNSDRTDSNEIKENNILLSQPGSRRCPVTSFKLYISKLTDLDDLFQKPNPYNKWPKYVLYKSQPVGEGTINKFSAKISKASDLNYIYTNHCIRGTTVTGMKKLDHSLEEVAYVLKHKNLESLKHYLDTPTLKDKENYAKSLFTYTSNDNNEDNIPDLDNIELPPPP